jgi:putative hemolysin
MQLEQSTIEGTASSLDSGPCDNYFSQQNQFEIKITQNEEELKKAKKLRLKKHSFLQSAAKNNRAIKNNTLYSKQLIQQQHILIHDGYDSYADHLIIIDKSHDKVVAYVRLIDAYTAYKIGGYYSETQFNLKKIFNKQTFYMEMSRLVIDPDYYTEEIASLLWSGIVKHGHEKGIDAIIGTLSLSLEQSEIAYYTLDKLKKQAISESQYRIQPYQLLPDYKVAKKDSVEQLQDDPVIQFFFRQGVKLCGEAFWNKEINQAELFIHYPLDKNVMFPECICSSEIQMARFYE